MKTMKKRYVIRDIKNNEYISTYEGSDFWVKAYDGSITKFEYKELAEKFINDNSIIFANINLEIVTIYTR